ncbi:MAG: hypothetical protein JJ939_12155 [Alphaproteobacteria bacterium]|nr:hypothetical protein [Alphaproteobacteria bacterium]MBO6629166.1 hypothetical protein [Alphaproteobacteria bacterium]
MTPLEAMARAMSDQTLRALFVAFVARQEPLGKEFEHAIFSNLDFF